MTVLFLMPNPERTVDGEPLKVFDPERKSFLPQSGAAVPANPYWLRRVADTDCIEYTPVDDMVEVDIDAIIATLADRFDAVDVEPIDVAEGEDQVLALKDSNGSIIAQGTIIQLTALADEADAAAKKTADKAKAAGKKKGK